jgi:hypothetical protein
MANLHQFSLGKRVIKKGRVQGKLHRGNRLQRCEFTCINRSAIVFLETKYEKPSISKIAAQDGAGSTPLSSARHGNPFLVHTATKIRVDQSRGHLGYSSAQG